MVKFHSNMKSFCDKMMVLANEQVPPRPVASALDYHSLHIWKNIVRNISQKEGSDEADKKFGGASFTIIRDAELIMF